MGDKSKKLTGLVYFIEIKYKTKTKKFVFVTPSSADIFKDATAFISFRGVEVDSFDEAESLEEFCKSIKGKEVRMIYPISSVVECTLAGSI